MTEHNPVFAGRTLIVAVEGWNDAAESASTAAKFVCEQLDGVLVGAVDPEEYYDFQFNRPEVSYDEHGQRVFEWPGTALYVAGADIVASNAQLGRLSVLVGFEPSRRWKTFTAEVLELIEDQEIDAVLFLGGMLADVPHSRPITVNLTSQNEKARQELEVEKSHYEGPVGILSVLGQALEDAGIPTVAIWASVPHYVHNTPSPKATLALLSELERMLHVEFDHKGLAEESFAWERGIDEIAESDEEMASYIQQLEKRRDEFSSPGASGDALAMEFEKFLRDKNKNEEKGEN